MAEVQASESTQSRSRKSTHVDMTAMVDVAFLLLTFFILTTTLLDPLKIELILPVNEGDPSPISQQKIMTLILAERDEVYWYRGQPTGEYHKTNLSENGLRQVIQGHLQYRPEPCSEGFGQNCWDPIFVIKPQAQSAYSLLIDALDELRIAAANKYTFGRFETSDSLLFANRQLVE